MPSARKFSDGTGRLLLLARLLGFLLLIFIVLSFLFPMQPSTMLGRTLCPMAKTPSEARRRGASQVRHASLHFEYGLSLSNRAASYPPSSEICPGLAYGLMVGCMLVACVLSFLFTLVACALHRSSLASKMHQKETRDDQPLIKPGDDELQQGMHWSDDIIPTIAILCEPGQSRSNLLRNCLRLHNQLEGILSLRIVSPEEYSRVVDECLRNGNMSGLTLLYTMVKGSGRESEFLSALRRCRSNLSINLSSATEDPSSNGSGSDASSTTTSPADELSADCSVFEQGCVDRSAREVPERVGPSVAGKLPVNKGTNPARVCQTVLLWVRAMRYLEDLLSEGVLDVYHYGFLIDLQAQPEKQMFALMEIVTRCNNKAKMIDIIYPDCS
eukprot:scpid72562/ scgid35175/ 